MTLPYQKHSETSRKAAELNTTSTSNRDKIYNMILQSGGLGLTADEIKQKFPESARVSTRVKELCDVGSVMKH